jgi:hypothetical protein
MPYLYQKDEWAQLKSTYIHTSMYLSIVNVWTSSEECSEDIPGERFDTGLKMAIITTAGDPPPWSRDTLLSTKVSTKFRRQVAVAQSV